MENKSIRTIWDAYEQYLSTVKMEGADKLFEVSDILSRSILIESIEEDTGTIVSNSIRFFNYIDEEAQIPVEQRKPIKIFINSTGGYLTSTFTVIDAISFSKTPVYTINIGCAYSGGFLIFISGHKRMTYPNASFLFHEGSASIGGDANKFQNQADFYKKQREIIKKIVLSKTNIDENLYNSHIKDDWWILSDEAIELKIADKISNSFEDEGY